MDPGPEKSGGAYSRRRAAELMRGTIIRRAERAAEHADCGLLKGTPFRRSPNALLSIFDPGGAAVFPEGQSSFPSIERPLQVYVIEMGREPTGEIYVAKDSSVKVGEAYRSWARACVVEFGDLRGPGKLIAFQEFSADPPKETTAAGDVTGDVAPAIDQFVRGN